MLKLTILDRAADVRAPAADDPGVYVWRDVAGRPCAYGHSRDGYHWLHWPRLASYQFDDTGREVLAYPAGPAYPDAIADTFHRMVLPLALQRRGLEALHASAVAVNGRVAAFCAVSGTGKSTLAYALARTKGHCQWSDDAVVFEVGRTAITAVPLPFDVRLLPEAAVEMNGRPSPSSVPAAGPPSPLPLGAICILVRRGVQEEGTDVEARRLEGSKALAAVLEHAHCFNLSDPDRKKRMLEHYLEVVYQVRVYEIRFTPGFARLDSVVEGISRVLER